jgi:hypothetical protein
MKMRAITLWRAAIRAGLREKVPKALVQNQNAE